MAGGPAEVVGPLCPGPGSQPVAVHLTFFFFKEQILFKPRLTGIGAREGT